MAAWTLDKNKVMTADEVQTILHDLRRRSKRSPNTKINDVIFRLSTICGLRASEIANLRICDVKVSDTSKPFIHVKNGKGSKTASVPIPDNGTAIIFAQHLQLMKDNGSKYRDLFLTKLNGKSFDRNEIAKRFKSAIRCLTQDRISELSVHSGRHTAATILLDNGQSLATVRDFCRHSNISTTSVYLHGRDIIPTNMWD